MKLYNTLTRKTEEFTPINPGSVGFYSCGPTVYDYAHIGHARTFIFSDILQRVLIINGYKVKRVMNITDVGHLTSDSDTGEDKMEKGAKREGKTVWDIAKYYSDDFFRMTDNLHIERPEIICKATDFIPEMIALIKRLEEKGFTYTIADGVYFDTAKFPDYGRLTGQTLSELTKSLKAGARVEMVASKKNPTDFALWKFSYPSGRSFDTASDNAAKRRQMEWESPWGAGFPGWHIECSAMSMKFLGETFDIHSGGVDHIPVHHTNEIAQAQAATGKQFVRFWLHAEHLLVEGQKMSKSMKNFYRLKDLTEKGYQPEILRYLFLTAHYRTLLNFTWKALDGAKNAFRSLTDHLRLLLNETALDVKEEVELSHDADQLKTRFVAAVNQDLNTARGLSILWEVLKSAIPSREKYQLTLFFDQVLGLGLDKIESAAPTVIIPAEVQQLVDERGKMRLEKKFSESDTIRNKVLEMGYTIEDTSKGQIIRPK